MAGSNGVQKYAEVNREGQFGSTILGAAPGTTTNFKDTVVSSYTKATSALTNLAYSGNIISTTQVPSTNPAPTTLTPSQFYNTLYFDSGTTNTINAPTLSSFLTYVALFQTLEPVMQFELHWVNTKPVTINGFTTVFFPDPAWGIGVGSVGVSPQSVLNATFTVINANTPASAVSIGANSQIQTVEPNFEVKTDLAGILGASLVIRDLSTAVTTAATAPFGWDEILINNTALGFGNAARAAAGFRDSQIHSIVSSALATSGTIGYTAGAYHINCFGLGTAAPSNVVFYVKNNGVMRATLQASASYTNAVLFDPATGEFGQAVSSERYKNTIVDADEDDLGFFDDVRPRTFKYNGDTSDKTMLGVIAEELEAVLPANLKGSLITYEPGQVISGINNFALVAALVANQKRLNDKILAQGVLITALTARVTALEA